MTEAAASEPAQAHPTVDTEGRTGFAATIVVSHAMKHMYTSALAAAMMPEIKLNLGLSATQLGTLGTVQQFSGWFSTMTGGYFGDRFTNKTGLMLAISLGTTGIAMFVLGLAPSYGFLIIGALLAGFGPPLFHPPAIGAMSRRFPDRRAFAISMHGMGGSIGEVSGPLVGAGLLAILYYQDILKLSMIPALIAAGMLIILLRTNEPAVSSHNSLRGYLSGFAGLLKNRALLMVCLVTALRSVGQSTTTIFLPVYLREDLGYSAALVGLYISMSQLAGIGSQPLMGFLTDRLGYSKVLLPALAGFALFTAMIPLAGGKIELAIVILALGAFLFSLQSVLTSLAVDVAGKEMHSTITSLIYASSFIGSLAPTLAGILADAYGLKSTFFFGASLGVAAFVVLAMSHLPRKGAANTA